MTTVWSPDFTGKLIKKKRECSQKLKQLERLRSEDTHAAPWLTILFIHMGSHVKTRQCQSYKFQEFAKTYFLF